MTLAKAKSKNKLQRLFKKARFWRWLYVILISGGCLTLFFVHVYHRNFKVKDRYRLELIETFNNNHRKWSLAENYDFVAYMTSSGYWLENTHSSRCREVTSKYDFPKESAIELKSTWVAGFDRPYGFVLRDSAGQELFLKLSRQQQFFESDSLDSIYIKYVNDSINTDWGTKQRLELRDGHYKYFVNKELKQEGQWTGGKITSIALRVCRQTKVIFRRLNIYDLDENKLIHIEPFWKKTPEWPDITTYRQKAYFQNGRLILKNLFPDLRISSTINVKTETGFQLKLRSHRIEGHGEGYGLIVRSKKHSFYFRLGSEGSSRVFKYDKNMTLIGQSASFQPLLKDSSGLHTQSLLFTKAHCYYAVDGQQLYHFDLSDFNLESITLYNEGKQTVAFDHLEIKEL